MTERLQLGDYVIHFKHEKDPKENDYLYIYKILHFAVDAESLERKVVYMAMYGENKIWIRNLEEFMGEVDKEKYPDIKQKYRFENINSIKKIQRQWGEKEVELLKMKTGSSMLLAIEALRYAEGDLRVAKAYIKLKMNEERLKSTFEEGQENT